MSKYTDLLSRLYAISRFQGIKLGLDNMIRLDRLLGTPGQAFPSVHVAGTNGKGSVVAKVAKGLEGTYSKVGRYISPHISSFRERITINGRLISEEEVEQHLACVMDTAEQQGIPSTFFELTTALAFRYFAAQKVDIAVIETGLGGRLDATNIVRPLLSVITSIDFDHMEILGGTLDKIAREKAGIIKPGVPVILGPDAALVPVLPDQPVVYVHGPFENVESENRAIARSALHSLGVPEAAIKKGLTTKLPCRRERVPFRGEEVILDVAHNPRGLERLFQDLNIEKAKLRAVVGLSKNKDLDSCLRVLQNQAENLHLVDAPNGRGAEPQKLKEILLSQGVEEGRIHIDPTLPSSLESAFVQAAKGQQQLLVCGTFFIMSESRKFFGIEEPQDPIDLNEKFSIR